MQTALAQPWETAGSAERGWYVRLLPCLTDFAFILPLFLLFLMLPGATQLLSDGDTGWHLRTGDWILQHHQVPTVDFFSFTMPGRTWFAWEWGWDVVFAVIHRYAGLPGVVFVNVLLICLASALAFRLIRRYSQNELLALAFTMLAVCGAMIHWLARPHLISWVFALLFSHLILSAEQGNRKALYYAPPLMLLWTNLHGGFFIGVLLLLTMAVGEAIQVTLADTKPVPARYRKALEFLACAVACALVTLVNPYGWHLHQHIIAYLRDHTLLDNISEFQTMSFHNPGLIFFESMLLLGVAAAFWCFSHRQVGLGLTVLLWAHAALFSGRNIPVFMWLSAAPAALMTQDLLSRLGRRPLLVKFARGLAETVSELRAMERASRVYLLSGLAVVLVGAGFASGKGVFRSEFNPQNFPLAAISIVHNSGFKHLFTADQWADYLLYTYYPSQTVFFDGRSDFYGGAMVKTYQHIVGAQYNCEQLLKSYSVDGVMVSADAPLATVLKRSANWKLIFDDGHTIVFRTRLSGTN